MSNKKDMSGALFPNDKGGVEKRPDFRGDILINGVEYKLSGWKREYSKGQYLSIEAVKADKLDF